MASQGPLPSVRKGRPQRSLHGETDGALQAQELRAQIRQTAIPGTLLRIRHDMPSAGRRSGTIIVEKDPAALQVTRSVRTRLLLALRRRSCTARCLRHRCWRSWEQFRRTSLAHIVPAGFHLRPRRDMCRSAPIFGRVRSLLRSNPLQAIQTLSAAVVKAN